MNCIACRDETIRLQDARIASLRAELAEARLHGRREGLEAWNRWYDAATADDDCDCEYLNGEGWNDAAKLRAIDPDTLLKDAGHG